MARESFEQLNKRTSRNHARRAEGEDETQVAPPVDVPETEEAEVPAVETKLTSDVEIPEGAEQLDAQVYTTPSGDLLVVPTEPLNLDGYGDGEPITMITIEVHEDEEEGAGETPEPADLETQAPAEDAAPAYSEEADTKVAMEGLNNCAATFVQTGSTENPVFTLTKNGFPIATIAYADQEDKSDDVLALFNNQATFSAQVNKAAEKSGWATVLPLLKAQVFLSKGHVVSVQEPVDVDAIRAEARVSLFNDMSTAWTALKAGVRTNPLGARIFEAAAEASIDQPDVFAHGVMNDDGEFIAALQEVTDEISGYSATVKEDFVKFVSRASSDFGKGVPASEYTPDREFAARLHKASVPVVPVETRNFRTGFLSR
jgi:hypothetical protein